MARNAMISNPRNPPTRNQNTKQRRNSITMATQPKRRNKERKEPVLRVVGEDIWQRIAQARRTKEMQRSRRKQHPT